MPRSLVLTLPWPPSLNRIYRAVGERVLLSQAAREYQALAAKKLPVGRVIPFTGRLAVTMHLCAPIKIKGRYDICNREKLLCDILTKQRVWLDDSQIDLMVIARGEPAGKGRVELLIQEFD